MIVVVEIAHYYLNVTTLRSGICCRNSVCLSDCLSSVTFVYPSQLVEIVGNVSAPFCSLAIR